MKFSIVPVTHYQQNCAIIWCEKTLEGAVVDPGGDVDKLMSMIDEHKIKLTKVVLTHGHMDHCGAAGIISELQNIPIEGPHEGDRFWIEALATQAQMMGFETTKNFTPDRWLVEGDTVDIGEVSLQVLHCPGHTPGHVVLFHRSSRMAFVGDVLFKGSIGRTDFPQGNFDQLVHSIRHKLWPLGDEVRFNPGHGPMSTFGEERQTNSFVADSRFG